MARFFEWAHKQFVGDPKLGAEYLPLARTLLGSLHDSSTVMSNSRQVVLPNGVKILVGFAGAINRVMIDVRAAVVEAVEQLKLSALVRPYDAAKTKDWQALSGDNCVVTSIEVPKTEFSNRNWFSQDGDVYSIVGTSDSGVDNWDRYFSANLGTYIAKGGAEYVCELGDTGTGGISGFALYKGLPVVVRVKATSAADPYLVFSVFYNGELKLTTSHIVQSTYGLVGGSDAATPRLWWENRFCQKSTVFNKAGTQGVCVVGLCYYVAFTVATDEYGEVQVTYTLTQVPDTTPSISVLNGVQWDNYQTLTQTGLVVVSASCSYATDHWQVQREAEGYANYLEYVCALAADFDYVSDELIFLMQRGYSGAHVVQSCNSDYFHTHWYGTCPGHSADEYGGGQTGHTKTTNAVPNSTLYFSSEPSAEIAFNGGGWSTYDITGTYTGSWSYTESGASATDATSAITLDSADIRFKQLVLSARKLKAQITMLNGVASGTKENVDKIYHYAVVDGVAAAYETELRTANTSSLTIGFSAQDCSYLGSDNSSGNTITSTPHPLSVAYMTVPIYRTSARNFLMCVPDNPSLVFVHGLATVDAVKSAYSVCPVQAQKVDITSSFPPSAGVEYITKRFGLTYS